MLRTGGVVHGGVDTWKGRCSTKPEVWIESGKKTASDYAAVLKKHGALASMSRPETPRDNAPMENFINTFYDCPRRHSAPGYLSPAEYEKQLRAFT
jgi:transposase InsO family protein